MAALPSAIWRALTGNKLFVLALVPAIALRADAELGYRWQVYFPDSLGYLASAVNNWPDSTRVSGYAGLLKLLQPFHSLALVTVLQHVMGLLVAVMIYAVARRYGVPTWLAVLVTVPVLYDGFEIQLEHLIMADTLFLFLVMLAVTVITWSPRPSWWACLVAGLMLGLSAVVRSTGLPLLAVFAVYLLIRLYPLRGSDRGGRPNYRSWLALAVSVVGFGIAFAAPAVAYERWYDQRHGEFAMTDSTGVFLYSRVMTFADCSRLSLPANLSRLCTSVPPGQRPLAQSYLWASYSPLLRLGAPEFSPQVNKLAEQFAIKAIEGQPLDYARVVLDDTWRTFGWTRSVFPYASVYDNYLFGGQNVTVSATPGTGWAFAPNNYVHGDPQTAVVSPYATVIRVYQRYVWLPGTVYGLILLAGLSGVILAWRRAGGEALLPWAVSLALIVVPAATAEFDYRYVLTAVPFGCLAAALAFGSETVGGRWLANRRRLAGASVDDTVVDIFTPDQRPDYTRKFDNRGWPSSAQSSTREFDASAPLTPPRERADRTGNAHPDRPMSRSARRNAMVRRAYADAALTAGPVDFDDDPRVRFRPVASSGERLLLTLLALVNAATAVVFIGWLLLPAHVPGPGVIGLGGWKLAIARISFCVVIAVETTRLVQNFAVWVFAWAMKDPIPKAPAAGLRVAILTTIVPSKEPIHVVERTLRAMLRIRYRGTVHVWILDEGDDPAVKEMAARLGVHHFSRKGVPRYNQPSGPFRAKTKSGNHNAWRDQYEGHYDVVAQMDPDHVPLECFLERTLGYFRDPDVAFVVAPQVYGNMHNNWVAHGASVQQYFFSGVVERGGNGMEAPLLIGTNHLYRPKAWREIGGYQDSIIEDHLTSMRVHGTVNPRSGRQWRGVYTPDVLAIGEGPESWTDYFNQQKRWAYGIWEILLKQKMRAGIRLRPPQRLLYGLVQFYYPSAAATLLLGSVATAIYLLLGITAIQVNGAVWVTLWTANMVSWILLWFWLRRFNLADHERRELGMTGMLLALFAGPIYVAAAARALAGRPLRYAVTAKGSLKSADSMRTFRLHLWWAAAAIGFLLISFEAHHDIAALRIWGSLAAVIGIGPPLILASSRLGKGGQLPPERDHPTQAPAGVPVDYRVPVRTEPRGIVRGGRHRTRSGTAVADRPAPALAGDGGPVFTGGTPASSARARPHTRGRHASAPPPLAPASVPRQHSGPPSHRPDTSRGPAHHPYRGHDYPADS